MNPHDTGVAIDPEFPVRNDPAEWPTIAQNATVSVPTPHKSTESQQEAMARLRANRRGSDYRPRQGEITIKLWRALEAKRTGLSLTAIANRLSRGKYPDLEVRRVNKRVVYVRVQCAG